MEIVPTPLAWLKKIPELDKVKQIIFTSQNAVIYFMSALIKLKISLPKNIKITAIGEASAKKLYEFSVSVDFIPNIANSEQLLTLDNLQNINGETILLIKGIGGRKLITQTLRTRGANICPITVYRQTIPTKNEEYIDWLWHNNSVDIILFTSYKAIQNIFTLFGEEAKDWLLNKPCIVISKRIADKAQKLGIKKIIVANYKNILSTLEGFKHDKYKR